ncbi:MAG: hypothetical protein HW378_1435 [Anaerolineales bacterium]|nr:hypothetical protein [Anaerolineales bacterium]
MPPLQFGLHIGEGEAARCKQDEGVIEKVGHLGDDALIPLPFDGEDDFHGLLPHFLHDLVFTCRKQSGSVRVGGWVFLPRANNLKKAVEGHSVTPFPGPSPVGYSLASLGALREFPDRGRER